MLGGRFEVNSFLRVWVCVLLAVCTLTAGMLSLFLIKRHVFVSGILFIFCFIKPILISGNATETTPRVYSWSSLVKVDDSGSKRILPKKKGKDLFLFEK
jgi:hypothetical protein